MTEREREERERREREGESEEGERERCHHCSGSSETGLKSIFVCPWLRWSISYPPPTRTDRNSLILNAAPLAKRLGLIGMCVCMYVWLQCLSFHCLSELDKYQNGQNMCVPFWINTKIFIMRFSPFWLC